MICFSANTPHPAVIRQFRFIRPSAMNRTSLITPSLNTSARSGRSPAGAPALVLAASAVTPGSVRRCLAVKASL